MDEIYTPGHLYPAKSLKLGSSLCAVAAEIPEDVIRAKQNDTPVPQTRFNYYTEPPSQIML
jgi:hypothetical protein